MCYSITLNHCFIDFWSIFRTHILAVSKPQWIRIESLAQIGNFFDVLFNLWSIFPFLAEHKIDRFSVFPSRTHSVGQSEQFVVWPGWFHIILLFTNGNLGMFPFKVPIPQKTQKTARRGAKLPPTGKPKVSKVTSKYRRDIVPLSWLCLGQKNKMIRVWGKKVQVCFDSMWLCSSKSICILNLRFFYWICSLKTAINLCKLHIALSS